MERLLRELRGSMGINGQCTMPNLKKVLMEQGLCSSGSKPELLQRVYNYIHLIREQHSLPMEEPEIAHVEEVLQTDPEDDDSDVVCVISLSSEVSDGNDILLCDGSSTIGYQQQCLLPPVTQVPNHCWFCHDCVA